MVLILTSVFSPLTPSQFTVQTFYSAAKKTVTTTEIRRKATPITTEMLNLAVESNGNRFGGRIPLMKEICEYWKEGCAVTIIRSGSAKYNSIETVPTDRSKQLAQHDDFEVVSDINNNLAALLN